LVFCEADPFYDSPQVDELTHRPHSLTSRDS